MKPIEFQIRKAVPTDALGIAIVSAYTWKTAYSGLLPAEMLDQRIKSLPQLAENMRQIIGEKDNILVATVENTLVAFCVFHQSRDENYPAEHTLIEDVVFFESIEKLIK